MEHYRLDERAQSLARGDFPQTWGLNFNAFPQCEMGAKFAAAYRRWSADVQELIPEAYVYPYEALHITVAPPAPFIENTLNSLDERNALEQAWLRLMKIEVASNTRWPKAPFPLIYDSLRVDKTAGIFLVSDPTSSVEAVRECIDVVARKVEEEVPTLFNRSFYRRPSIVHTTFLRWIEVPADDVMERWAKCAQKWESQEIWTHALTYVRETTVYQHGPRPGHESEEDGHEIIHRFPYL